MIYQWQTKVFKTKEEMKQFTTKHSDKIQWAEVFVNNAYAIEYRKLRRIF